VIVDYHMHLRGPAEPSGSEPLVHTVQAIEPFVVRALERGVTEIGFTEHVYYFAQTREAWALPYHVERCTHDLDAYCDAILAAKRRGLPVKLGLEVDHVGERQALLSELLAPYPWDYLLGSVHDVLGAPVDQEPGVWAERPVEEVWRAYFAGVEALVASGAVDVLAHPDLAKIYGRRPDAEVVAELHEHAAPVLATAGVALEVSTAGLRKPVGEIYPDVSLLEACRRAGVPITTASDAHAAELVGFELEQAVQLVRRAGYETVTAFDARRGRQEPLG
jgi:histidinol-phosphatase (PHP family)